MVAALTVTLCVAWCPASASAQASTSTSAAVVDPLLQLLLFGNNVGLPLACEDLGSLVSTAAGDAGFSGQISPILAQFSNQCQALQHEGATSLQAAETQSEQLALLNPLLDPAIAGLASGVQNFGNNYGSSLAPFGPTIAGLGGTIAFFEGT
jgi:hypothetical protein